MRVQVCQKSHPSDFSIPNLSIFCKQRQWKCAFRSAVVLFGNYCEDLAEVHNGAGLFLMVQDISERWMSGRSLLREESDFLLHIGLNPADKFRASVMRCRF
jgi:hypothetical protein